MSYSHGNPNSYSAIHKWLKRNYGTATKCEDPECKNESKKYEYALRKGMRHSKNIGNYLQLCKLCHIKYDSLRLPRRKSIRKLIKYVKENKPTGELNPLAKLSNKNVVEIRKLLAKKIRSIDIAAIFGVSQQTICDIKNKRTWVN